MRRPQFAPLSRRQASVAPEPTRSPIAIRRDGQANERGTDPRSGFPHDDAAMVLHHMLADAQIRGDVLAGMAGEHELQNLPLTRRQTNKMRGGGHAPLLLWRGLRGMLERTLDTRDKALVAERLFDEVGGPGLHGLDGQWYVTMSCDHDRPQSDLIGLEPSQQLETICDPPWSISRSDWRERLERIARVCGICLSAVGRAVSKRCASSSVLSAVAVNAARARPKQNEYLPRMVAPRITHTLY